MPEKKRCRFEMFVRLKPENILRYPNNSLIWCHRGDKYTQNESKMMAMLVQMLIRHHEKYKLVILYDNNFPMNDMDREVLKVYEGKIEKNRLRFYYQMIPKIVLPQWLK